MTGYTSLATRPALREGDAHSGGNKKENQQLYLIVCIKYLSDSSNPFKIVLLLQSNPNPFSHCLPLMKDGALCSQHIWRLDSNIGLLCILYHSPLLISWVVQCSYSEFTHSQAFFSFFVLLIKQCYTACACAFIGTTAF